MSLYRGPSEIGTSTDTTYALVQMAQEAALTATDAAQQAQALLNDFKGRWYGGLMADPITDPLGQPLTIGDSYWNIPGKYIKNWDGVEWVRLAFDSNEAGSIDADWLSDVNISVPTPALTGGLFVVDGNPVLNDEVVFLPAQANKNQNGPWQYDSALNLLTRPTSYASGVAVGVPFQVNILYGDFYADTSWLLVAPVLVDASPSDWVTSDDTAEVKSTGTFLGGPESASKASGIPDFRRVSAGDLPPLRKVVSLNSWTHHLLDMANPVGYMSRYIEALDPWNQVDALYQCVNENNVVVFDVPVYFRTQPLLSLLNLNGKHFIFQGRQAPIWQLSNTSSVFDLSGSNGFTMEGHCVIRYTSATGGTVKAIKGTGITNFRAGTISTENVAHAFNVDGVHNGIIIDAIRVANPGSETALTIDPAAAASNANKTYVRRVEGRAPIESVAINTAYSYNAWTRADTLVVTGTMTAGRIITMNLTNATQGYTALIRHNAAGGFALTINDSNGVLLKSITNGQTAEMVLHNGLWYLKS